MTSIVVCTWEASGSELAAEVQEALTLARRLEAGLSAELRLLVLGALSDGAARDAARLGAPAIDHVPGVTAGEERPDALVTALAQYCAAHPPDALLFAQSFLARLVAPRLAGRLGAGVVMNCVDFAVQDGVVRATASAYGGDTRAVYECGAGGPYVFAVNPNAVVAAAAPGAGEQPSIRTIDLDVAAADERIRVLERPQEAVGPRLEHAQIIVAGGRGLGMAENFRLVEELAAALGGMAGASRPIVDDGWAKPAQQVGLTGKVTKPALYIAAGISGASQHMVGCAAAKTFVAVNRDASAAIFRYAHYGIVGDCVEILPALTRAVKKARGAA